MQRPQPLWLFGENRGQTMNNNSWHAYRRVMLSEDPLPVRAHFVLASTPEHRKRVAALPRPLRRGIVWRDSRTHRKLFARADRFFITLSFQDIEPPHVTGQSTRRVPLVHLQHGTIGIKQVGYHGDYYRGTIDAFCVYTDEEAPLLEQHNGFRREQLFRLPYPPRYGELLQVQGRLPVRAGHVLWFLTWRDYLEPEIAGSDAAAAHARTFVDTLVRTVADSALAAQLGDGLEMAVCFHQFFPREILREIEQRVAGKLGPGSPARRSIRFHHASDVDLMELMAKAEMLVTDYSSLAYDMSFLRKPVCMYLFDLTEYLAHRTTYIDLREVFTQHVAHEPDELAPTIRGARGTLHPHYAARVQPPLDAVDHLRIAAGEHADPLLVEMLARDTAGKAVAASDYRFWPMSQSRSGRPSIASDTAIA